MPSNQGRNNHRRHRANKSQDEDKLSYTRDDDLAYSRSRQSDNGYSDRRTSSTSGIREPHGRSYAVSVREPPARSYAAPARQTDSWQRRDYGGSYSKADRRDDYEVVETRETDSGWSSRQSNTEAEIIYHQHLPPRSKPYQEEYPPYSPSNSYSHLQQQQWPDETRHHDDRLQDQQPHHHHSSRDRDRQWQRDEPPVYLQPEPDNGWDTRRSSEQSRRETWDEPSTSRYRSPSPPDHRQWEPAPSWNATQRNNDSQSQSNRSHDYDQQNGHRSSTKKSSKNGKKSHSNGKSNGSRRERREEDDLNNWSRRERERETYPEEDKYVTRAPPPRRKHSRSYSRSRSPAESYHSYHSRRRTPSPPPRVSPRARRASPIYSNYPDSPPPTKRRRRDSSPHPARSRSPEYMDRGRSPPTSPSLLPQRPKFHTASSPRRLPDQRTLTHVRSPSPVPLVLQKPEPEPEPEPLPPPVQEPQPQQKSGKKKKNKRKNGQAAQSAQVSQPVQPPPAPAPQTHSQQMPPPTHPPPFTPPLYAYNYPYQLPQNQGYRVDLYMLHPSLMMAPPLHPTSPHTPNAYLQAASNLPINLNLPQNPNLLYNSTPPDLATPTPGSFVPIRAGSKIPKSQLRQISAFTEDDDSTSNTPQPQAEVEAPSQEGLNSLPSAQATNAPSFIPSSNSLPPPSPGPSSISDPGATKLNSKEPTPAPQVEESTSAPPLSTLAPSAPEAGASSPPELYSIISQVGEGTFGKVYKACNAITKVHVALKRIRMESERDGFPVTAMREIKLLQSLRHDNVVRLYEMMVSSGNVYMVFEYLEHDLTGVLSQTQFQFSAAHLKSLCHQMFRGLAYLHHKGVIHRDIKGSNILINNHGELKLADFGLARFYQKRRRADYTNRVITLWYRPPELLFGATVYGPEVDIWSAGCIMLELFTKKPVFQGNDEISQLDVIYRIIGTPTLQRWSGFANLPWYEMVKPKDPIANKFRDLFRKWMSPAALDLAERLLDYDPAQRITATDAMETPYFLTEEPKAEMPTSLATLEGEWHELETKRERAKKKKRE